MLKEYLEGIKDLTSESNELTHRPSLYNLLDSLKDNFNKEFKIEHEPNRDKQWGQPDFRISYQGLNIGYIENKRVRTDLNQLLKSDQILKYLELNPNLMLTDYLNFMWVGKDEENKPLIKRKISIASLDELSKPLKPNPQTERDLIELFRGFFNHEAAPITNAKDFANALSAPTKYLKDALIAYQKDDKDDQVSSIFKNFKEYLYEELSFEDFSDAFAQTLTYSLFLAKLNHPFEKIDLNNVRSSIPKNFAVIREMADFLKKLDAIKEIQWLLNEILILINHVDMGSIIKDLNDDKDPYLHFYETFLSAYDPKLREKKGVYYTPDPVVKFIINALDSLLKTHFKDAPLGLKSALDNENIKLLDFATGTGTFLLEAFGKALEVRKTSDGGISTKEDKYQNLLKQFYGFEYLIAPYAIAHLNLSQAFKEEFKKSLKENDALKIILTNTLIQPSEIVAYRGLSPIFEKELLNAQKIKKNENILIITGNPPYSGASENKGLFEWEVKATYGIEPEFQTIEIEKNVKLTDKIQTLLKNIQKQKESSSKDALKALKSLHSKYKLQDNGSICVIGSFQNIFRIGFHLQNLGFWILNDIIWHKSNPVPNFAGKRLCNAHETLIWCAKHKNSKVTFNYKTMKYLNNDKQEKSVWQIPICIGNERLKDAQGKKVHSTQKPEALLKKIILSATKPKDIILDPFFGTGTTGAVAKSMNRYFIGIEKDSFYIKEAAKRLNSARDKSDFITNLDLETKPPKIPMSLLISKQLLKIGDFLYSSNKEKICQVLENGQVRDNENYETSIHKMSAKYLNKTNHNGWKFFYAYYQNQFLLLDELRYICQRDS
ncbi:DNA methyltransferase [Helicobacter pylori]